MENRERDRVSKRTEPTEAGELNRQTEERKGREQHSGTSAEFGQNIGRSEHLSEGDNMRNREEENMKDKNLGNDSGRSSGSPSGYGSSSGRSSGSMENVESGRGSKISEDQSSGRRGDSGSMGGSGSSERIEDRH